MCFQLSSFETENYQCSLPWLHVHCDYTVPEHALPIPMQGLCIVLPTMYVCDDVAITIYV